MAMSSASRSRSGDPGMRQLIFALLTLGASAFVLSPGAAWQASSGGAAGTTIQHSVSPEAEARKNGFPPVLVPTGESLREVSRVVATLSRSSNVCRSAAFSPDGRFLAAGCDDYTIHIWDTASGKQLRQLAAHRSQISTVAFSPDGRSLASGSSDNTVIIWDFVSGKELWKLEGHAASVQSVVFAPDGRSLASGSMDHTIIIWDLVNGKELRRLEGNIDFVLALAFAPDGGSLASSSWDNTIRLWDVATGKQLGQVEGHTGHCWAIAFAPDRRTFASGCGDNTIHIWDLVSRKELRRLEGHSDLIKSVTFAPNSQLLVSGSYDKTIRLWDTASGKELKRLEGHTGVIEFVALSPGGSVASGGMDGTVRLWDLATGQELLHLQQPNLDSGTSVSFSPDGRTLGSGGETVHLWDAASGEQLQLLEGHTEAVNSVVFSPDGHMLASGSSDKTIRLWDPVSGEQLRRLDGHTEAVNSIVFSPDGHTLASGSSDKTIRLWDPLSGKQLQRLDGHTEAVNSVVFSPDGRTLASGSSDKTIRLWDPVSGKQLQRLDGHTEAVYSIVFSPDGRTLASASSDKTIRLWDPVSGKQLQRLDGHTEAVYSIVFSPDGRTLASASSDKTIRLWNPVTGKQLQRLDGHTDAINYVAFSPDGRELASTSSDKTIRLWTTASGKEVAILLGDKKGLWLSCLEEKQLCWRADDGTLLAEPDSTGLFHPLPPQGQTLDGRLPVVNSPQSVKATEGKTVPVRIELHNLDGNPLFWINIHAEASVGWGDVPLVAFHPPPLIERLDGHHSVTVEGWVSVLLPYLNPKPEQELKLQLVLEDAGSRRVMLSPISVSAPAPSPSVEEVHLSKSSAGDRSIVATLVNKGAESLEAFATRGQLHDKGEANDHSKDTELGTGSSPSADPSAPPMLEPDKKMTITFAVQKGAAIPGQPELELAVRSMAFPLHEWRIPVPVISPSLLPTLAAIGAGVLLLVGLFYYQWTYRNPLLIGISADPAQLFKLDVVQLPDARSLLARTRRLDWVLRKAEVALKSLDDAVGAIRSKDPTPRAALLGRKLEARIAPVSVGASDLAHAYLLNLPEDFRLNLQECLLLFVRAEASAADVLAAWRQSEYGRDRMITLVLSSSAAQREDLRRQLDQRTDAVVVLGQGEETSLLIGPNPPERLARIISRNISLTRISPYQINAGVERDAVFFGRSEQLRHILNRDPGNYLIVGARQLGKSSLLLAIERRVEKRGDMSCTYISVGLDSIEPAIAAALKLPRDSSFAAIMEALRKPTQKPKLLLLDECDTFIETDGNRSPPFPILDALRTLSSERRCYFILAGFWKLFETANADYFAPIRNFGETLTLGPLEREACRALLKEPMETIGIGYADEALVDRVMERTGMRPNLIQIACNQMIRDIGQGRVIDGRIVDRALSSDSIAGALDGWRSLTSDSRASRIDRIVVYAMLDRDDFLLGDVIDRVKGYRLHASTEELRISLLRLNLAFIFGEDRGRYSWRVPLFRDRRRLDEPERQIADEVAATG
jgi:WD40 repeat protein